MNGILVYDKADAEYNKWFIEHIISTGKDKGMDIGLVLTEDFDADNISCDFAIMRNRNHRMNALLEEKGIRCFNSSYVCRLGNDKWEMYRDFSSAGIPVMFTQQSRLPLFPFVLKPKNGHGGKNVFLVNNKDEYEKILCDIDDSSNYIYQMVATEKGRDIRVYVVGDMILTAMERKVAGDSSEFRANFSLGGSAKEYALTDDEIKLAAKVANRLKADFIGIDIIYNNGKPIVNEIEDAVGTRMLYSETDIDAVEEYLNWINKCMSSN